MSFFKQNPFFYSLLFILLGGCLVGLWYLAELRGELSLLKSSYETKASQYDRYLAARPSPTRSNLEAIEKNYRELYTVYEEAMRGLNLNTFDRAEFYGQSPVSRADWSFELHKFKENARYAALSNSVELPAVVDFGFEDYSNGGPPAEEREQVHQQIVITSWLLDTLFDSGIMSFVKVQRGIKPAANGTLAMSRRPPNRLYGDGDRFAVVPGQSVSVPKTIDSYVFRIVFRGQSFALREFLNRIANSSLPFVVRGIEADLSSEGGEKLGLDTLAETALSKGVDKFANQAAGLPIISDNTSLFVVTVEFLQLSVVIPAPVKSVPEEGKDDA